MEEEIDRINQLLPTTPADEKTEEMRQWMISAIEKMDHYKAEHHRYVKDATTIIELALWKAKLGEKEEDYAEGRTTRGRRKRARKERCITSGASIVIKNVLPFLQLA